MRIGELSPAEGATKATKRLGRGIGSRRRKEYQNEISR